MLFNRIRHFGQFYARSVTIYQLHSPFVFELAKAVLEDKRQYYAFRDVELLRQKMLESDAWIDRVDYGAREGRRREKLSRVTARSASSPAQGRLLFRIANHLHPKNILELGSSVGIGTLYLASAARNAHVCTLEGCPQTASIARNNYEILGFKQIQMMEGPFDLNLPEVLKSIRTVDLVYLDGDHRPEPTLRYFEQCLAHATESTVFVFDDIYWSNAMTELWGRIKNDPRVTLTVDFFSLSLAFVNPAFKEKQHFRVVPLRYKPWKVF